MPAVLIKDFPDDLHYPLKIQAAVEQTTVKGLILKAVHEYLVRAGVPMEADQRKEG